VRTTHKARVSSGNRCRAELCIKGLVRRGAGGSCWYSYPHRCGRGCIT